MPEASPDVTVLVPALNEQDTIGEVVERLLALPLSVQIVVIDDGSTDRTPEILASFGEKIEVLRRDRPGGKGSAIRHALPKAKGKAVIIQDADLEYSPEQIPTLVRPILEDRANVVYGNRFANGFPAGMAFPNKLVNWLLAWAVRLLYWRNLHDEATCYKAFRRELLNGMELVCHRFEFCPEATAKAYRFGEKILEIPIRYEPRTKEAGKKIRWTDAPEAFWTLLRHRFWKPKQ